MVIMRCREDDIVNETQGFPEQGLGVVVNGIHGAVVFVWLPRESFRTHISGWA